MRFFWGKVMKYLRVVFAFCLITLLAGCESSSVVMRQAPREGLPVSGLNVLFRIEPLAALQRPGLFAPATLNSTPAVTTVPREQAERLADEIKERLIPQLRTKGIGAEYASVTAVSGVAPPSLNQLFPGGSDRHVLVITPVSERVHCPYGGVPSPYMRTPSTCRTFFTLSLSLRRPVDNREVWNLRLVQSEFTSPNFIESRNHVFIDDIAKSVLAVVRPR
jgi:hypothetical protein